MSRIPLPSLPLAVLALAASLLLATVVRADSLALRNVKLIDSDTTEPVTVNLLVRDDTLVIITRDLLPLAEAEVTYDGEGGSLVGQLVAGGPATFLLLSDDPRQQPEILLDTKQYARFAILRGRVLKNSLAEVTDRTPEEIEREAQGWLAYQPPPLALPTDYFVEGKWNRVDGRLATGLFAGAVVLDHQTWIDQDSASLVQVDDLESFDGGQIRALRFGVVGTINLFERPWIYTVFGATNAFDKGFDGREDDQFSLYDLRLDIPLGQQTRLSVGKQKEPVSMERLMSLVDSPMQERAAVSDALLPARNVGMVVSDTLFGDRVTAAAGVFNNWLDRDQPNAFSDNNTVYTGRATWLPYLSDNESTLLHLGIGLRYSDGEEPVRARSRPETSIAPLFVDTGFLGTETFTTTQFEASLRTGPLWLHSEFTRVAVDAPALGDPQLGGYFVSASYFVTGEMRPYRKRIGIFGRPGVSRDVNHNGWGAWELAGRFSHVDLADAGVDGGEMDITSAGFNWWLTPYLLMGVDYRYIELDRFGDRGTSQSVTGRLGIFLE